MPFGSANEIKDEHNISEGITWNWLSGNGPSVQIGAVNTMVNVGVSMAAYGEPTIISSLIKSNAQVACGYAYGANGSAAVSNVPNRSSWNKVLD